jgi:hypothetical protein
MSTNKLHNELYKLAIAMAKFNGKTVKQNLDYLLGQEHVPKKERNNSIR